MMIKNSEDIFDTTIKNLHAVREKLVAKYNGDLMALTADARVRQEASGRQIVRRASKKKGA